MATGHWVHSEPFLEGRWRPLLFPSCLRGLDWGCSLCGVVKVLSLWLLHTKRSCSNSLFVFRGVPQRQLNPSSFYSATLDPRRMQPPALDQNRLRVQHMRALLRATSACNHARRCAWYSRYPSKVLFAAAVPSLWLKASMGLGLPCRDTSVCSTCKKTGEKYNFCCNRGEACGPGHEEKGHTCLDSCSSGFDNACATYTCCREYAACRTAVHAFVVERVPRAWDKSPGHKLLGRAFKLCCAEQSRLSAFHFARTTRPQEHDARFKFRLGCCNNIDLV